MAISTSIVRSVAEKSMNKQTLASNIVINTTQVATDTIDYVATDQSGLTATSTRTIIIQAPANNNQATTTPANDNSPPPATTSATTTAQ
jgi:hypothetical protein